MTSLREVASRCGVTPMTVSLVLNKPEKISPQTRERVLGAIRETGYRPRAVRRPPPRGGPATLGALNKEYLTTPGYMTAVLDGIRARTYEKDQNLILFPGHLWDTDPQHYVRANCDGLCDGMLFIATSLNDAVVSLVKARGLPFVLVGESPGLADVAAVDVDNTREEYRMTEFLIHHGHRRIAFMGIVNSTLSCRQRETGYRQALAAHGLAANPALLCSTLTSLEAVAQQAGTLLTLPPSERPTAIVCWNDGFALRVLETAHHLGLRVPEEVSVVGFDDAPEAQQAEPPLTTMRQPYDALGAGAVNLLLEQIRGEEPRQMFLPAELIERGSAAPASPTEPMQ